MTTITTDYSVQDSLRGVFLTAFALELIGVILGILMLAVAAIPGARPRFGRLARAFGILAPLLVLLAALPVVPCFPEGAIRYFIKPGMTGDTAASFSGFWGATTWTARYFEGTVTWSTVWGAAWGWYSAVVSVVVLLFGGLLSFRSPARADAAGTDS